MCHFGHICHNLICTYWVQLNGYAAVSLQAVNCCLHLGASAAVANRLLIYIYLYITDDCISVAKTLQMIADDQYRFAR